MINEKINNLLHNFNELSDDEKREFAKVVRPYWPGFEFDNYDNPTTTIDNIKELQEKMVQLCIDYLNEHELNDVDIVDFSVDELQYSKEQKCWTPMTDSFIEVYGVQEDKNGVMVRKKIGSYC